MRAEEIHRRLAELVKDADPSPAIVTKYEGGAFLVSVLSDTGTTILQYGLSSDKPEIWCENTDLRLLTRLLVRLYPEWVDDLVPGIQMEMIPLREHKMRLRMHARPAEAKREARTRPVLRVRKE